MAHRGEVWRDRPHQLLFNTLLLKLSNPLSGAEELAHFKRGLNRELRRNVEYQDPPDVRRAQSIAAKFARIDDAIAAGSTVPSSASSAS